MVDGFTLWLKHPITGIGYNRVREYKALENIDPSTAISHSASAYHSFWVTILATTGIIGVILFGLVYAQLMQRNSFFFFSLLFAGIIGIFDNVIFQPLFIASLVVLSSIYREEYKIIWRKLRLANHVKTPEEGSPSASTQD